MKEKDETAGLGVGFSATQSPASSLSGLLETLLNGPATIISEHWKPKLAIRVPHHEFDQSFAFGLAYFERSKITTLLP